MKASSLLTTLLFACMTLSMQAQNDFRLPRSEGQGSFGSVSGTDEDGNPRSKSWGRKERTKKTPTPKGVSQWTVDPLLGDSLAAENTDTAVHNFQWWNLTDGFCGEYQMLGNAGSPRLSRIYLHRPDADKLLFLQSYDYFIGGVADFRFTNSKSPLTNLAYHKVGNSTNGQDRVRGYFSTNINAHSGVGFLLDYLYGRGYYNSQANSMFGGSVFGYHMGERYQVHAYVNATHNKMAENGGLESDTYITDPQSLPQRYGSKDIPTNLTETWNRNDGEQYFLGQRYRLGYERELSVPDSLKPKMPNDEELMKGLADSLRLMLATDSLLRNHVVDSLRQRWQSQQIPPTEFVAVGAIGHTLNLRTMRHRHYSYATPQDFYTNLYYGDLANIMSRADALQMNNTVSLSMLEGFSKWAAMDITAFATHQFERYNQPRSVSDSTMGKETSQNLFVGGRLSRRRGNLLNYDATAQFVVAGDDIGDFNVHGNIDLNIPLGKRDTLELSAKGFIKNMQPVHFLERYHSQLLWWDNDLDKEFKTRVEGTLTNRRTKTALTIGVENVKNLAYLAAQNTLLGGHEASTLPADYSHDVVVRQHTGSIQVFSASLSQDVKLGPLHWDNTVTYQTSSQSDILPLPTLNVYSNLYLKFRIAKTLNVQLGGDVRYFTNYYAPTYSAAANMFVVQDTNNPRTKIGNYPVLSAYANLHLKHCRIYVAAHHLNSGTGRRFWAPQYAIDPMTLRFGISWNFFN